MQDLANSIDPENFDDLIDRRDSGCAKWGMLDSLYGLDPDQGLAMWVADTDFRSPRPVQQAVAGMLDHGVYGYYGDKTDYHDAIIWWMKNRHNWSVNPDSIFTTHGLVNGFGMCLDAFTDPGDAIILFTPVYHVFEKVIKAADRSPTVCPLVIDEEGQYRMDLEDAGGRLTGKEKMIVLCSPHNPGGRVWSRAELEELAQFARTHDLLILSDEIHHDLLFPGHVHTPMALIDGIEDRLIMMTAPSKTFNIAGAHNGNVIITDPDLHKQFTKKLAALGISPNIFGVKMTMAAYSSGSISWLDKLMVYLDENRKVFDEAVNQMSGLVSMPLESTYLAWVDFSATGLTPKQIEDKIRLEAGIAASNGSAFGTGGETFMRFNLGTQRSRIEEAVERLGKLF